MHHSLFFDWNLYLKLFGPGSAKNTGEEITNHNAQPCQSSILIMDIMTYRLNHTGYMSQGSLTCPRRSAGFDLTGPLDFLLAQSHTELRLTDLHISDYLNIYCLIFRPATCKKFLKYTFKNNKVDLRQHLNTFRVV